MQYGDEVVQINNSTEYNVDKVQNILTTVCIIIGKIKWSGKPVAFNSTVVISCFPMMLLPS